MTENYKSLNKYFHRTRKVSIAFLSPRLDRPFIVVSDGELIRCSIDMGLCSTACNKM